MKTLRSILLFVVLILSVNPNSQPTSSAQNATCLDVNLPAFVETAHYCQDVSVNTICRGSDHVYATFRQPVATGFFTLPGDRSALSLLGTLHTSSDVDTEEGWGVAVIRSAFNLPQTLAAQHGVVILLLGDATLTNRVDSALESVPSEPVEGQVSARGNANVRVGPSPNSAIVGSLSNGTHLLVDGRSADGEWLRVLFEQNQVAWISRSVVSVNDIGSLPVVNNQQLTTLQSFELVTETNAESCSSGLLLVQSPQHYQIHFIVNGADVSIASSAALRSHQMDFGQLSEDRTLMTAFDHVPTDLSEDSKCKVTQLIVVDGSASLNNGSLPLPTGFTAFSIACEDLVLPWGFSRPATSDELNSLQSLEGIPDSLLNYAITLPTQQQIQQILQAIEQSQGGGGAPGCEMLRQTSPLDTMANSFASFYWNGISGATHYVVNVFDRTGQKVTSLTSTGANTNVGGDVSQHAIGGGREFSWNVEAYSHNRLLCRTPATVVIRDQFGSPSSGLSGEQSDSYSPPEGQGDDPSDPGGEQGGNSSDQYEPNCVPYYQCRGINRKWRSDRRCGQDLGICYFQPDAPPDNNGGGGYSPN